VLALWFATLLAASPYETAELGGLVDLELRGEVLRRGSAHREEVEQRWLLVLVFRPELLGALGPRPAPPPSERARRRRCRGLTQRAAGGGIAGAAVLARARALGCFEALR
jgi:hypothetical protein